MNYIVSSIGKFHSYSVAKEFHINKKLNFFITAHPRFKLNNKFLNKDKIYFIDMIQSLNLISKKYNFPNLITKELNWISHINFDKKSKILLKKMYEKNLINHQNTFLSLSGSGLFSGRFMRSLGSLHLCDVGSTHIKYQNEVLKKEFHENKIKYFETDSRLIDKECLEFDEADKIIVPSEYVKKSFIKMKISEKKIIKIPYGSDNAFFKNLNLRNFHSEKLTLSFAGEFSIRKGLHYLLNYFQKIPFSLKKRLRLNLYGSYRYETKELFSKYSNENIYVYQSLSQDQLSVKLNETDIYVLLSIEEGLSLTIPQAMSVGCIVIATPNTGAEELIKNGHNGFIPILSLTNKK